jgi:L-ascorbate metabolism protein UlaG (beta-lactamase superfamily)
MTLRRERTTASKQFRNGAFRNTANVGAGFKGNPLPVFGELVLKGKHRAPKAPLEVQSPLETWATSVQSGLRVTWMGHSTLLFELDGFHLLTDPVFGERASPFSFAGAKRFHEVPASIAQLPPLDAVLLSHDHYDHLCSASMRQLAALRVPIVTSLGVGAHLERFGVEAGLITELDWWEQHSIKGISLTATPSQHFSGRGLHDRNATLWSSWVIQTAQHKLFFSGDTGLTNEFIEIKKRLGPFDLTMLEIGAWNQAWGDIHLGPVNALRAFEMLGGGTLLPIHWSTFDLAIHHWSEPAETLFQLAQAHHQKLLLPRLGNPVEPCRIDVSVPWWRLP